MTIHSSVKKRLIVPGFYQTWWLWPLTLKWYHKLLTIDNLCTEYELSMSFHAWVISRGGTSKNCDLVISASDLLYSVYSDPSATYYYQVWSSYSLSFKRYGTFHLTIIQHCDILLFSCACSWYVVFHGFNVHHVRNQCGHPYMPHFVSGICETVTLTFHLLTSKSHCKLRKTGVQN